MSKEVSFKVSKQEAKVIHAIAERAVGCLFRHGIEYPIIDAEMDVTAVHANGNPLRLDALLSADDFNFSHDIIGIFKRLDRSTGKLTHCFLPRFTRVELPKHFAAAAL